MVSFSDDMWVSLGAARAPKTASSSNNVSWTKDQVRKIPHNPPAIYNIDKEHCPYCGHRSGRANMWTMKSGQRYCNDLVACYMRADAQAKSGSKMASRKTAMPAPSDHGVEVGSIFYSSWGYGQTNVDFYEVIALTPQGVKVCQINKRIVRAERGSEYVVPRPGVNRGDPMTKRLKVWGGNYGISISFSLNSYSDAYLWDGNPKQQTDPYSGH